MDSARGLMWTRDGRVPAEFAGEELLVVDLFDLLSAFRGLLGRLDEESRLRLRRDDVSVAEKFNWLTELLEVRSSVLLADVFRELPNRIERIAAFLAMLEMIRLRMVVAFQTKRLGEIRLALRVEPEREDAVSAETGGEPDGAEGEGS
jgi:segregation and condensation protein A